MPRKIPTCSKCGQQHYNVVPCQPSKSVPTEWAHREGWRPFGDRLDFLSPERQHVTTGRLSILPPKRDAEEAA